MVARLLLGMFAVVLAIVPVQRASATCGDWLQHGPTSVVDGAMGPIASQVHVSGGLPGSLGMVWSDLLSDVSESGAVPGDLPRVQVPGGERSSERAPRTPCRGPGCRQSKPVPQAAPVARPLRMADPVTSLARPTMRAERCVGRWFCFSTDATTREGFPLLLFRPPCV